MVNLWLDYDVHIKMALVSPRPPTAEIDCSLRALVGRERLSSWALAHILVCFNSLLVIFSDGSAPSIKLDTRPLFTASYPVVSFCLTPFMYFGTVVCVAEFVVRKENFICIKRDATVSVLCCTVRTSALSYLLVVR